MVFENQMEREYDEVIEEGKARLSASSFWFSSCPCIEEWFRRYKKLRGKHRNGDAFPVNQMSECLLYQRGTDR